MANFKLVLFYLALIVSPHVIDCSGWKTLFRSIDSPQQQICCYSVKVAPVTTKAPCVPCLPPTPPTVYTPPPTVYTPPPTVYTSPPPVYTQPPVYKPAPCPPPACPTDHKLEIDTIIKDGTKTAIKVSGYATAPVVYVAERISIGADMLPMLFAAGGSILGSAIATPIQFFNTLGSGFISGTIGQLVTIPISLGTTVKASIVGLRPYFSWFTGGNQNQCCGEATIVTESNTPSFGHILLKPIGILGGGSGFVLGSVITIGGKTFRLIGKLVKSAGATAEATGLGLKTTGALKVADGISSIASFYESFGKTGETICVEEAKEGQIIQSYYVVTEPQPAVYTKLPPSIEKSQD